MMKKSKAEIDKSENKNKGMQEDEGYKTAIAKQIEKECSVVENQEQEEEDAGNDVGNSVEDNQIYENNGFNFEMDDEESRSSDSSISISSFDLNEEEREFKDMKKVVRFNSLISSSTLKNKEWKHYDLNSKSSPNICMGSESETKSFEDILKMKSMSFISSKIERSRGSFEAVKEEASYHDSWRPRSKSSIFDD